MLMFVNTMWNIMLHFLSGDFADVFANFIFYASHFLFSVLVMNEKLSELGEKCRQIKEAVREPHLLEVWC